MMVSFVLYEQPTVTQTLNSEKNKSSNYAFRSDSQPLRRNLQSIIYFFFRIKYDL